MTPVRARIPTVKTAGDLRREIAAKGEKWSVDPRLKDADVLPVYHMGGDLQKVPKVNEVPRADIRKYVSSVTPNPFLIRRRVDAGFIDGTKLASNVRVAPAAAGAPSAGTAASVDWRNRFGWQWLTNIKDQNGSENCWVFSAVGVVEAMTRIAHSVWSKRSEGDARDGMGARTSDTGEPGPVLDWMKGNGIADPGCWPTEVGGEWDFWHLQQINRGGVTGGAAATSGPFIGVYHEQQHFAYLDAAGTIWDSWYDGGGHWNLQKINNGGNTPAPSAAPGAHVSIWVDPSNTQQHFTFLALDLGIYDAFWDSNSNSWHWQKVNLGGTTSGPAAAGSPSGSVYHNQQHIAYLDSGGNIWDPWYDGSGHWNLQKINNGGNTSAPGAMAGSLVSVWVDPSNTQQHFTFLAVDHGIYDAFWDSNSNSWHLQKINLGGNTSGPAATSSPFGCVYHNQQHIGYLDSAGNFWDSWYDGSGHWNLQKINNGGMTSGPAAAGGLFVSVYNDQQHFTYRDTSGNVQDAWYGGGWNLQTLTGSNAIGAIAAPALPDVWNGTLYGPPATGDLSVSAYSNQQHFAYRDSAGDIWDAYYNGGGGVPYAPSSDRNGRSVRLDDYTTLDSSVQLAFVTLNDIEDQKNWLDTVGPITACFEVYHDFWVGSDVSTGVYTQQSNDDIGGHCVVLVGYDDTKQAWLMRNSWGTWWGDSGYCWFGYGQCGIDNNVKYGIPVQNVNPDPWSKRHSHHGSLLESGDGTGHHNFELWTAAPDGAVRHYWRDGNTMAWSLAETFANDCAASPCAQSTTFNRNFEMVFRTTSNRLHHWYFDQSQGKYFDGGVFGPTNVAGIPGFIQGNYGSPGAFELVVMIAGGQLVHWWRPNTPPGAWTQSVTFGSNVALSAPTLVQRPDRGLDVVVVNTDGTMQRYNRNDAAGFGWSAQERFGSGVKSPPVMIQGQYGATNETLQGNYELCVAVNGQIQHWWRDNQGSGNWSMTTQFGTNVAGTTVTEVLGMVEGSYGFNLELVARLSNGSLQHFYRDGAGWHADQLFGSAIG